MEQFLRGCCLVLTFNIGDDERAAALQHLAIEEHIISRHPYIHRVLGFFPDRCARRRAAKTEHRCRTESDSKNRTHSWHKQAGNCATQRQPRPGSHRSPDDRTNGFTHTVRFGVSRRKLFHLGAACFPGQKDYRFLGDASGQQSSNRLLSRYSGAKDSNYVLHASSLIGCRSVTCAAWMPAPSWSLAGQRSEIPARYCIHVCVIHFCCINSPGYMPSYRLTRPCLSY